MNGRARRVLRKKNPVPPGKESRVQQGADLFKRFRGHAPGELIAIDVPDHDTVVTIGECDGILYTTERDGEIEAYVHKFKKTSRPILAVSTDGEQLYLLGGAYKFTELGIVDDAN